MKIDLSKKITEYAKKILVITLIIHICILSIGNSSVRADDTINIDEEIEKLGEMPPDKERTERYIEEILKPYIEDVYSSTNPNLDEALKGNFNADPNIGGLEKALACLVYLYGETGSMQLNPYESNDFGKWITISGVMSRLIDEGVTSITIDGIEYKIDEIEDWDSILRKIDESKERTYEEEKTGSEEEPDETNNKLLEVLDGIAGVLFIGFKIIPIIIGGALELIMNISTGEEITIYNLLFNKVGLTDINFFENATGNNAGTVNAIRDNVAIWYVSLRNLAAVVLALILIYVAIRMAISTIAEEKAKYKRMLIDWTTSLCLLFVLHYIMVIVININNSFVSLLAEGAQDDVNLAKIGGQMVSQAFSTIKFTEGVGCAVAYMMLVGMSFIYFFAYIKRMITLAFLIIISPLITITYSIDKMGDGKSQALNTWLKEFIYNILIQPFQCVIYLSLVGTVFKMLVSTDGSATTPGLLTIFLAVYVLMFMFQAEEIVKNIFGFKSQSMGKTVAAAAVTGAVIGKATSLLSSKKDKNKKDTSGSDYKQRPRTKNTPTQDAVAGTNRLTQNGSGGTGNPENSGDSGQAPGSGDNNKPNVRSIEQMYSDEGFGKNDYGEYFDPWHSEFNKEYSPEKDDHYIDRYNAQFNNDTQGQNAGNGQPNANDNTSGTQDNQSQGSSNTNNTSHTKTAKKNNPIIKGAKTVGKGLLKANVNTGLRIAGLALGLSTGDLNTGIAGWGLGSAQVSKINSAMKKHSDKKDEDSRFCGIANSIDDFQGDDLTNTQVMQRTADWLDGISMPDRDDEAGLKLYQQLMEEQEIQMDQGKSRDETREIIDQLIKDSLSGAQSRVPKASLAQRVKNKFASQSGDNDDN